MGQDVSTEKSLVIKFGDSTEIMSLDGLSDEQILELKYKYIDKRMDLQNKADELKIDAQALSHVISVANEQVMQAKDRGVSATIEHTQSTTIGKTNILVGNTEHANKGRLSKVISGENSDGTRIAIIIAIAIVLAAIFLSGH